MSAPTDDAADELLGSADAVRTAFGDAFARRHGRPILREIGRVRSTGHGVAMVDGLAGVRAEELVELTGGRLGLALNLEPDRVGVVLLDEPVGIDAGSDVRRTGRVLDVPVGRGVIGRVLGATGLPLDGGRALRADDRSPVHRAAPRMRERAGVQRPLQTGIKVIDALVPIGRGQRELILGDRQTGKTAIAIDTIINQRGQDVICIYCAIGQRRAAVAQVITDLRRSGAMDYTTVVVASGDEAVGLQYIAPYAATALAEYFMERGQDVLVVFDDLTRHARAYRELSLLLRRPPGREAYPGDIFYIHSQLLERATHLTDELGGGSLTALPIAETQEGNLAAYIPTNLISITDGQIYLSPRLFRLGILPAVDIGLSVSRVGGRAQLPAYGAVVADLRIAHAQFEELERFSRYGARLERGERERLERGRRVREVLKQPQHATIEVAEQIAVLLAVTSGVFDAVPSADVAEAEHAVRRASTALHAVNERIRRAERLAAEDRQRIVDAARDAVAPWADRAVRPA